MYLAHALARPFAHQLYDPTTDMHRLFEALDYQYTSVTPSTNELDLYASDESLRLTIDAPGLDPASIDLSVLGDTLTIRATAAAAPTPRAWLRRERSANALTRTVHLPYAVDAEKAEARYRHGVISITLHRQAGSKPQRIAVQAA